MPAVTPDTIQFLSAACAGVVVGFTLSLVGGGGSILAVPLMVYLVGVPNPHVAIGTSALAVAVNASTGLLNHARAHTVKWRCGFLYASVGVMGALAGSIIGKSVEGQKLLFLFAMLMFFVGALMLRGRNDNGLAGATCNRDNAPKVIGLGLLTGALSGFFGIGGGFLIVPGLIASTQMPIINAIGTSLIAVAAFGLTTAVSYAVSGLIDWPLAGAFIAGGIIGGVGGAATARRLSGNATLKVIFSCLIFGVAAYMLWKSSRAI